MSRALVLSAFLAFTALGLSGVASAQVTHTPQQPYAHLHSRPIKALSDQQIADLAAWYASIRVEPQIPGR